MESEIACSTHGKLPADRELRCDQYDRCDHTGLDVQNILVDMIEGMCFYYDQWQ